MQNNLTQTNIKYPINKTENLLSPTNTSSSINSTDFNDFNDINLNSPLFENEVVNTIKQLENHNVSNLINHLTKNVPSDGNCLFWATMLAYLEPVKTDNEKFKSRYIKLFGNYDNYEKIFKFSNFDFDNNKNLVLLFRNRVIDYIEKNIEDFKNFEINNDFNQYLQKMRKNGKWGGEIELSAISKLLNLKIIVDKINKNKEKEFSKTYPENFNNNFENEIKIIHINDNHYQYYLNNDYQVNNMNQSQNLVNCQPITIINTIRQNPDSLLTSPELTNYNYYSEAQAYQEYNSQNYYSEAQAYQEYNSQNYYSEAQAYQEYNSQNYYSEAQAYQEYNSQNYKNSFLRKELEIVKLNNHVLELKLALENERKYFTEFDYNLRNLINENEKLKTINSKLVDDFNNLEKEKKERIKDLRLIP